MFLEGVELPDELRIALEENRLVIFTGAGVSVPPPSSLPTFNALASQIAGGESVITEQFDRYLGKLQRERNTNVHAAAARIVYGDHTKPTLLHREILRVFGTESKCRVVTTNFDDHFSTESRKLFKEPGLSEFYAPALPLGDDFCGLVYLHGSARADPTRLVLTDRDFGSAYLTRGWARDFLVRLFGRYAVLFVGYSHNDVTTTYLARGLDPSGIGQRWAMVASDAVAQARDNWKHLDIPIIEYPIDPHNSENKHHALTAFFSKWADHRGESNFRRAKRLKSIARGLPPESPTHSTYIDYCLSNARLGQEFCKSVRHSAWVGWMHDRGYFDAFFKDSAPNAKKLESQFVLANWLCSDVRCQFPDVLLDVIRRHSQRLTDEFCHTLAHNVWADHSKTPDPRFATWVSLLLPSAADVVPNDLWAYLLNECRLPAHTGIALSLFELLTAPVIHLRKSWNWSSLAAERQDGEAESNTNTDFDIAWPRASGHWLREAWAKIFAPNFSIVADALSQIIQRQLTHAYLLLRGVGVGNQRYDHIGHFRRSIAKHEQDDIHAHDCLSFLIDALRAVLDFWIETNPMYARARTDEWWSTKLLLLMRFAAYARSRDPLYTDDVRIEWVLKHDLVFRSGMKKEIFDILASAYPNASRPVRQKLIRRIERGYRGPGAKALDHATLAYEKFNVLIWLRRFAPECPLIGTAISSIQVAFPHFAEREYPELDSWTSSRGFVDPEEDFDLDRIVSAPPEDFANELLRASEYSMRRDLWAYLQVLPKLFSRDSEWGWGLVAALAQTSKLRDDIWNRVFSAWRDILRTNDSWHKAFALFEQLPQEVALYSGIASLISHGIHGEQMQWDAKTIDRAAALMDRAWELTRNEKEGADNGYGDWLTTAINHVGGWIGEFWVYFCDELRKRAGDSWHGIPASLKSRIVEALHGDNRTAVHARVVLTPWIGTFFAWDRPFTVEHMLPLLDWKRDPVVAQQSWSVLLNYNRGTSVELECELMPLYRQCAEQLVPALKESSEKSGQFSDMTLRNLGQHLAAVAMHVIPNPVESGFFRDFLPLLPDAVRGSLAIGMGNDLKRMNDAERQTLWNTWLRNYLDLRLVGVPVALSTAETQHMLEWCLHMGPLFAEAVERIAKMPQKDVFAFSILRDLCASPLVDGSPLAACRLIISALEGEDHAHLHKELITLHERLKLVIPKEPEFAKYEELLFDRGWTKP